MEKMIILEPVFKETIWGGHALKDQYGFNIPSNSTGECWAISAHPNGDCKIKGGEYDGQTLSWLWDNHRELFGNLPQKQFPLLVKFIDANQDLSVQVHPNDQYAAKYENSLGKNECWYVLGCKDKETRMVMGHHAKSKEELIAKIENDDYDSLLNVIHIKPGEFYYIPAGTIHAICSGSLICEVQQSSDVTYRVYDYHRKDKNGNERELHVQKSLDVTAIPGDVHNDAVIEEKNENYSVKHLLKCEFFNVDHYHITGNVKLDVSEPMILVSCIDGKGIFNDVDITKGMSFIIPSNVHELNISGKLELIMSTIG